MPFQQQPQINFGTPAPAFRPFLNFQQPIDSQFDAQLISSFAMNDLTHTIVLNNMYHKDVLILAEQLNTTNPKNWPNWIKNTLMTVNPTYWNTHF